MIASGLTRSDIASYLLDVTGEDCGPEAVATVVDSGALTD
jgi:hypothetical protein